MYKIVGSHVMILVTIFALGLFLRIFKIAQFPVQLNHDEITQLYDAISIAHTGRDIYGNFLPVIFPSVGDFKPPFYTYITSLFVLAFGSQEMIIRMPSVIFGSLTVIAVYFFTKHLLRSVPIALLASVLTAISPAEIFFSRKSFENGAGVFLMLTGFAFLMRYLQIRSSKLLFCAALIFGFSMYTYFSHAVIIPLAVLTFVFVYKADFCLGMNLSKIKRAYLPAIVLWFGLILPLVALIVLNPDTRYRSQTVFMTQDIDFGTRIKYLTLPGALHPELLYYKEVFDFAFTKYLAQFDVKYLFGRGLDFTSQDLLGMGPLMLAQFPFVLWGIVYIYRKRELAKAGKFLISLVAVGMLPSALTFEDYSPHRVIMVFTMLNIITSCGIFGLFVFVKSQKYRLGAILTVCAMFALNFIYFLHMYFINYPYEKSENMHYPFKEVALFAWSRRNEFDSIVFDPLFGKLAPTIGTGAHYYFAYYGNLHPAKFQLEYKRGKKAREVLFDKFSIRKFTWPEDYNMKNSLVIASQWSLPKEVLESERVIQRFYFYDGSIAFYAVKL